MNECKIKMTFVAKLQEKQFLEEIIIIIIIIIIHV
jgi:hypothetical protein